MRSRAASSISRSRTTTTTCARRCSRQAPRGETFRGDAGRSLRRHRRASRTTSARVLGFAWDLTGDGKTSLRGGGGMFYDQHRDGESGNGAVNAAPWSIRLAVTRPTGPFSDPYRGRTDFNLITDGTIGTQQAPFPDAGADRNARRDLQDAAHLQLQPHVRARVDAGVDGARRLRRLALGERTPHGAVEPGRLHARRHARHRRAPDLRGRRASVRSTSSARIASRSTTACSSRSRKRYSHGFTVTSNYTLSTSRRELRRRRDPVDRVQPRQEGSAGVGAAVPGPHASLHDVVGVGSARREPDRAR